MPPADKDTDETRRGALLLLPVALLFLLVVPACLALGLWLLGVPLDWSSWKTYAGFAVLTLALGLT